MPRKGLGHNTGRVRGARPRAGGSPRSSPSGAWAESPPQPLPGHREASHRAQSRSLGPTLRKAARSPPPRPGAAGRHRPLTNNRAEEGKRAKPPRVRTHRVGRLHHVLDGAPHAGQAQPHGGRGPAAVGRRRLGKQRRPRPRPRPHAPAGPAPSWGRARRPGLPGAGMAGPERPAGYGGRFRRARATSPASGIKLNEFDSVRTKGTTV